MDIFKNLIPFISASWKAKYQGILAEEHVMNLEKNIQKYKTDTLEWDLPYFMDEIKVNRQEIFDRFINILESREHDEAKAGRIEEISIEDWLIVLGQRLTSASIRDENAVPPFRNILIQACREPFNNEISIAQRAWEKHNGRMDDYFWGEVKGNNQQKQAKVMEKICYILENQTWWNVFFHYKHGLVFEIREKRGHGIRWNHGGTRLIGFLEKFFNE